MKGKRILYFGLDPTRYQRDPMDEVVHLPLIRTEPRPFEEVKNALSLSSTHVLFTSRMAVTYYFDYHGPRDKPFLCIGEGTAARLVEYGIEAEAVAELPQAEGVLALLKERGLKTVLYPHSAQARPLLPDYLGEHAFPLYDVLPNTVTLPDLELFDRLVFTSPSTVEVFHALSTTFFPQEKCEAIGPITQNGLNKYLRSPIV